MRNQQSLLADLLDWKGTYKALPPIYRFIFFALLGIELDGSLSLLGGNLDYQGSFGVLIATYRLCHVPAVAIGVDLVFTFAYLYLAFWFLKKGLENWDVLALVLFSITLTSPEWMGLFKAIS